MKKILVLILLVILPAWQKTFSQDNSKKLLIKGTVTDAEKKPVANAFIMVDGVKTSQVTNIEGEYRIKVSPDAKTLGVVAFGLGVKEQEISGRILINFSFSKFSADQPAETAVSDGEEYINMGYDYTKKKNNTYSVGKHSGNKATRTYTSIYDMLREMPGVRLSGSSVIIHESRNLDGFVPALIVVDGVPVESFEGISPSMVESIEVLKDASASIYGTRAYGGVVIIKTRNKNK